MNEINSLVPYTEAMRAIGVRSRSTMQELIRAGHLPKPVARGRNRFWLASELRDYINRAAQQRAA